MPRGNRGAAWGPSLCRGATTARGESLVFTLDRYAMRRVAVGSVTVAIAAAFGMVVGCGRPAVDLFDPVATAPDPASATYSDAAWSAVLRDNVRDGLVDYRRLAEHRQPLEDYLRAVEFSGPSRSPALFPDAPSRLAYYLNVFNACVLKAVLNEGIPASMHEAGRARLEHDYRFRVDGAIVKLEQIRAKAGENSGGNALIALAMCDAAMGSPPLTPRPFCADTIVERLRELGRDAMDNPVLVRVDHEHQRLLIGEAIWTRLDAFKGQYRRETASDSATILNCLMHMAGGRRRDDLIRATGYDARMLPFNRALNVWTPEASSR
jgi:hypothetical protein